MIIKHKKHSGYIALISALILAFILVGLTFTAATSGFFTRFNILDSEDKRVSLSLAESCVNAALLKIAVNYSYAPASGGDAVPVGTASCTIAAVSYIPDSINYQETASIITRANFNGAFSTIQAQALISDPAYPLQPLADNISIISWQENP